MYEKKQILIHLFKKKHKIYKNVEILTHYVLIKKLLDSYN